MKEIKESKKVHYEQNNGVEPEKSWEKGQVLINMPESLKKVSMQLKPDKDLRRNEVKFERNPFVFEDTEKATLKLEIPTKTKKKIVPREFCADLLEITKTKHYTFEKIDSLNNEFGMNAWSYRGGFYTNGNTGETTPYCRHIWSAKTVKVIKKK